LNHATISSERGRRSPREPRSLVGKGTEYELEFEDEFDFRNDCEVLEVGEVFTSFRALLV
jgi:hypothetical protein